jgi:SAM-dependent methyltransferase
VSDFVLDVPKDLYRSWYGKEEVWQESAQAVHALLCDVAGVGDLGEKSILDYGCGSKMSKLFLENDIPVKRYVGIDTGSELVEFLQSSVADERFEYHHVNIYNEMYNREGSELAELENLPVHGQVFDVICLFSVFTHLAPHDYRPLLRLLRPHASENSRLVYTIFLNERTLGGHAMMDKWGPVIEEYGDIPPDAVLPDFVDFFPDKPLRAAVYSRTYALELVKDTGWRVEEVRDPTLHIQHAFVLAPD